MSKDSVLTLIMRGQISKLNQEERAKLDAAYAELLVWEKKHGEAATLALGLRGSELADEN